MHPSFDLCSALLSSRTLVNRKAGESTEPALGVREGGGGGGGVVS